MECTFPSKTSFDPKLTVPVLPGPMGTSSFVKYINSSKPRGTIVVNTVRSIETSLPLGVVYSATPVACATYRFLVEFSCNSVLQSISLYCPKYSSFSSLPYSTPSGSNKVSPLIFGNTTTPTLWRPASAAYNAFHSE